MPAHLGVGRCLGARRCEVNCQRGYAGLWLETRGYPRTPRSAVISSRIAGSSIVGGIRYCTPSAIFFMVPRRIFPERVFGSRLTTVAAKNPLGEDSAWDHEESSPS